MARMQWVRAVLDGSPRKATRAKGLKKECTWGSEARKGQCGWNREGVGMVCGEPDRWAGQVIQAPLPGEVERQGPGVEEPGINQQSPQNTMAYPATCP